MPLINESEVQKKLSFKWLIVNNSAIEFVDENSCSQSSYIYRKKKSCWCSSSELFFGMEKPVIFKQKKMNSPMDYIVAHKNQATAISQNLEILSIIAVKNARHSI